MRFFEEFRKRMLVQWGIAYLAGAFALLQVVDVVAGQFGWPTEVQRVITLIIALGFFVVLLVAWYHGERGVQRVTGMELLLLALLLAIGGVILWQQVPDESGSPQEATASQGIATTEPIRSIAVLPLDNYSGEPEQDYFAEGITDELTAELAMISSLKVISRGSTTQFKGDQRLPSPEIARLLGVDAIIEGSVRRVGDRVRVTAQLVDARDDRHLWAQSFDRNSTDVLSLQAELASAIAREVDVRLTPDEDKRLGGGRKVNPDAYDAYLQGRYFFNRPSDENLDKAIRQFEQAVEIDPGFAPAWSGLSDAFLWAGYNETVYSATTARAKAREAAEKAVMADPDSAEAHTSLAVFKLFYEYDWAGSEAEFRKAFALNDNYAYAHDQFSLLLAFTSRHDEAIEESRIAADLDPLSPQVLVDSIFGHVWKGDHEAARRSLARASNLAPEFFFPPWSVGWIELQAGRPAQSAPHLEAAARMDAPPFAIAWLGYALAASGDREGAQRARDQLTTRSIDGYVSPFNLAIIELGLGNHDKAVELLEEAYRMDTQWMGWLGNDRIFDPLRDHPRFRDLIAKVFGAS